MADAKTEPRAIVEAVAEFKLRLEFDRAAEILAIALAIQARRKGRRQHPAAAALFWMNWIG